MERVDECLDNRQARKPTAVITNLNQELTMYLAVADKHKGTTHRDVTSAARSTISDVQVASCVWRIMKACVTKHDATDLRNALIQVQKGLRKYKVITKYYYLYY